MNTRVRTTVRAMKAIPKHDKEMEKEKASVNRSAMVTEKGTERCQSRRERKIALQQDVDKLRKKLRHEENVHRALERAFTRPLGALPRLPPYLPSHTLELLAEVAVLEEEVVRLEEQVVNFRQGLYQEAIYISSSKKTKENGSNLAIDKPPALMRLSPDTDQNGPASNRCTNSNQTMKKVNSSLPGVKDRRGKENQLNTNYTKNDKQSPVKKVLNTKVAAPEDNQADELVECRVTDKVRDETTCRGASNEAAFQESSGPNKLSEDILKCLKNIILQMSSLKSTQEELEPSPSVSGSSENSEEAKFRDAYGICGEFGKRDIGPYKNFQAIELNSNSTNLLMGSSFLIRRLKLLLRRLSLADLSQLTHQQKLAFWINIYNSCMMNAFLEQGIPSSPEMVVALIPKAMINVGGQLLSAMTIEHFILRLPYHAKHAFPKGAKGYDMAMRGIFGLEWPEPLVTFALSCGSWSSPAVRVYTAARVDYELETAKREYLQAAVGISTPDKLAIPKLLDWYLLDFAKDVESLMDWICLQLPDELRTEAVKCIEMGRRNPIQQPILVLPYEFRFRYLLAP